MVLHWCPRNPRFLLPFLAPMLSESAPGTAARCKALGAGTDEELEAEAITLHHWANCPACQLRPSRRVTRTHCLQVPTQYLCTVLSVHTRGCLRVPHTALCYVYRKVLRQPYSGLPIRFPPWPTCTTKPHKWLHLRASYIKSSPTVSIK